MAFFPRFSRRVLVGGAATAAGTVYMVNSPTRHRLDSILHKTEAEAQFLTSFGYSPGPSKDQLIKPPTGWSGPVFEIRNDYPKWTAGQSDAAAIAAGKDGLEQLPLPPPGEGVPTDPLKEKPWMKFSYETDPLLYCEAVKLYCLEGNVVNDFVVQKNPIRDWYHAPWMHWSPTGREPLHGLTYERSTPPFELSKTQPTYLQTWACGFYNRAGAAAFGRIWANPNKPDWSPFKFPDGAAVFKILMTNATNEEVPSMTGAPGMQAVISVQPDRTQPVDKPEIRMDSATTLRLLQMDFAVQDPRSPIGWVFGTFMYDGSQESPNPWDRIIPVGLQWGNDPWLTPTLYKDAIAKGKAPPQPKESWIYPPAEALRIKLGGKRPFWGFDGRLNGPADNFKSACASCHSTSEWNDSPAKRKQLPDMVPPGGPNVQDAVVMRWFRNVPGEEPFEEGSGNVSGDYSLQLQIGMANYWKWRNANAGIFKRTMMMVPGTQANRHAKMVEDKAKPLRDV